MKLITFVIIAAIASPAFATQQAGSPPKLSAVKADAPKPLVQADKPKTLAEKIALNGSIDPKNPVLTVHLSQQLSWSNLGNRRNDLLGMRIPEDHFRYSTAGDQNVPTVTLPTGQPLTIEVIPVNSSDSITATFGTGDTSDIILDDNHLGVIVIPAKDPLVLDIKEGSSIEYKLSIGPAALADFTSQVGVLGVYIPSTGKYEFGLRSPTYTVSSKLTLDAISVFNGGNSASLGAGLTYSTLLGTSSEPTAKTIFGFPAKITFTVGFVGLTFGNGTDGSGSHPIFFSIGLSIPTGKASGSS